MRGAPNLMLRMGFGEGLKTSEVGRLRIRRQVSGGQRIFELPEPIAVNSWWLLPAAVR